MPKTKLDTQQVQTWLKRLGYYDGSIDGDYQNADYRAALRRFQTDYRSIAGDPDGWYGLKTETALLPLIEKFELALKQGAEEGFEHGPTEINAMRRWKLTYYYIGDQRCWSGQRTTPFYDTKGGVIATVEAGCYVEAALEGTTRLRDGRLVNVAKGDYKKVDSSIWAPVYSIIKRNGWLDKPGYGGVALDKDKTKVVGVRCFCVEKAGPNGYPIVKKGIELKPFRTLATDMGLLRRDDPQFKKRGGVVPAGTEVFVLGLVGKQLPDGTTHDGWCVAADVGGGIFGAHADLFTGSKVWAKQVGVPDRTYAWFSGIEKKLPVNYSYGL